VSGWLGAPSRPPTRAAFRSRWQSSGYALTPAIPEIRDRVFVFAPLDAFFQRERPGRMMPMSFLVHWIPALAGGFVLLIASWVLETRIRAERRAQAARGESTQPQTTH
jgi:hypothetical protein